LFFRDNGVSGHSCGSVDLVVVVVYELDFPRRLGRAKGGLALVESLSGALAHGGDHRLLLFLGGQFSLFELDPIEPSGGDELEDKTPNEGESTNGGTDSVLLG
jgi:hypothetical protein